MAIRYVVRRARRVERTTARREARGDVEINTRMFDVLQVDVERRGLQFLRDAVSPSDPAAGSRNASP